jgi:hypothetical protein
LLVARAEANQHPISALLVHRVKRSAPSRAATTSEIRNCASSAVGKAVLDAKNGLLPLGWSVKPTPAWRVCQPLCQSEPHLIG